MKHREPVPANCSYANETQFNIQAAEDCMLCSVLEIVAEQMNCLVLILKVID